MVISRSDTGKEILLQMEKEGLIALTPISIDEAITMHSHGYDLKKRGTFIRIRFRKMLGLPVPDYGYTLSDFTFTRYFMEIMIDALFLTLGTATARWLVEQFSPSFIGKLFEHSRKIWKKSTHKIKRQDLQ